MPPPDAPPQQANRRLSTRLRLLRPGAAYQRWSTCEGAVTERGCPRAECDHGLQRHRVNFEDGSYTHRVENVSISRLRIVGFDGDGIFADGSANLRVWRVEAVDNTEYGIARFDGIRGWIKDSSATGSDEAGIYIGDSPESHALVRDNRAWNNGIGVFVRHVHFARVIRNEVWDNCMGIFLLHDGQPEGNGDNRVAENTVRHNNKFCEGDDEEGVPETSGGGIVLFGSVDNVIHRNLVVGNAGETLVSGGIVLLTAPYEPPVGSNRNHVTLNRLEHNAPATSCRTTAAPTTRSRTTSAPRRSRSDSAELTNRGPDQLGSGPTAPDQSFHDQRGRWDLLAVQPRSPLPVDHSASRPPPAVDHAVGGPRPPVDHAARGPRPPVDHAARGRGRRCSTLSASIAPEEPAGRGHRSRPHGSDPGAGAPNQVPDET